MIRHNGGRARRGFAALTAGVLALAACGGDGDETADESSTEETTTSTAAEPTDTTSGPVDTESPVTVSEETETVPEETVTVSEETGRLVPAPCESEGGSASEADGVAADSVNVATLSIDFAALAQIGFAATELLPTDVFGTFVDDINASGGVCGRTIDLQRVAYDVIAGEGGQACVEVTEDRTNLVVSSTGYDQPTCITDAGVPLYATTDVTEADLDRGAGLLFSRVPTREASYLATVEYAEEQGYLDGIVGVWYGGIFPDVGDAVEEIVFPVLDELGVNYIPYRTDTAGPSDPEGNATLTAAATDFVGQGVDTLLNFHGPTHQTGMQTELHAQGLDPRYISAPVSGNTSNEIFADRFGTRDFTTGQQWITYSRGISEVDASDATGASCNEQYTAITGETAEPRTFDYQLVGQVCTMVDELVAALSIAGDDLTRESFVQALEQLPSHRSPGLLGEIAWTSSVRAAAPVFSAQTYDGASNTVATNPSTFEVDF